MTGKKIDLEMRIAAIVVVIGGYFALGYAVMPLLNAGAYALALLAAFVVGAIWLLLVRLLRSKFRERAVPRASLRKKIPVLLQYWYWIITGRLYRPYHPIIKNFRDACSRRV